MSQQAPAEKSTPFSAISRTAEKARGHADPYPWKPDDFVVQVAGAIMRIHQVLLHSKDSVTLTCNKQFKEIKRRIQLLNRRSKIVSNFWVITNG